MVLKRKRKREYSKELKIFRGVFDTRTLMILYRLLDRGVFDKVIGAVKEGKESLILSGMTSNKEYVAIKVYRTEACNFKTMRKYLVGDPRFFRMKKARRSVINLWCQREFKNLQIATRAEVDCPKPISFKENILVMSFIGENGEVAPRLIDIIPENPEKIYKITIKNIERLTKAGLVHGELSAYNILLSKKPYLIDFSHGTSVESQLAPELLEKDLKNINTYFNKLNVAVKDSKALYERLIKLIEGKNNERFHQDTRKKITTIEKR